MAETTRRPWMFPPDYEKFASLVRQYVVLSILHQAVLYDARRLACGHKFSRVYRRLAEQVADAAIRERQQVRQEMQRLGGKMVLEKQDDGAREVVARFRGRMYTQRLQNGWLRVCCEERLMHLLAQVLLDTLKEQGVRGQEKSGGPERSEVMDETVASGGVPAGMGPGAGACVAVGTAPVGMGCGVGSRDDLSGTVSPRGSDAAGAGDRVAGAHCRSPGASCRPGIARNGRETVDVVDV